MASPKRSSPPPVPRAATLPQFLLLVVGNVLAFHVFLLFGFMTLWSMLFLDSPQAVGNLWFPLVAGVGSLMTVPVSWILLHVRRPAIAVIVAIVPGVLVGIGILTVAIFDSML